ncbi:hypothetical protein D3C75_731050 [compost metagenome]
MATRRPPGRRLAQHRSSTPARVTPPPMKIASGCSRPCSAAGALPRISCRPGTPSASRLCSIKPWRPSSASMAKARQAGWARIHSMPIEPQPAPTSHSSSPGCGARRARVMARTSRLVSWPSCRKALSGNPASRCRRGASGVARHSMATRLSAATSLCGQSWAVPANSRSSTPPKCSKTRRRLGPKPRSRSCVAIAAGLSPSLLSTSRRTPLCRWALSAARGRATSDTTCTSCSGQPRRAAARAQEEGIDSTRISAAGSWRARLAPTP